MQTSASVLLRCAKIYFLFLIFVFDDKVLFLLDQRHLQIPAELLQYLFMILFNKNIKPKKVFKISVLKIDAGDIIYTIIILLALILLFF